MARMMSPRVIGILTRGDIIRAMARMMSPRVKIPITRGDIIRAMAAETE